VEPGQTQQALRVAFTRWGLPDQLRVDNGSPWGSCGDLPTALVLWLAGLGVAVCANPPRRPQDNGVVERSQGTGKRWADPLRTHSVVELQRVIDRMDRIQREVYPYRNGESRWQVYPELFHSGRCYDPGDEPRVWNVSAAYALLSNNVVARRVDSSGCVSVYNRNHYFGKRYAGGMGYVGFDPQRQRWLLFDDTGHLRNEREADELSAANILALRVTHHRERNGGRIAGKT